MERNGVQKGVEPNEEERARQAGTGTRKEGYQGLRDREALTAKRGV